MAAPMVVAQENCSGCLCCALACSFYNTPDKVFNPSKAYIKVERLGGQNSFCITYLEDCIECGKCTEYCQYGVLACE